MPTIIGSGVTNFANAATSVTVALNIAATGSNRVLVACAFCYSTSSQDVTGVTYNGVAMTAGAAVVGVINDSGTLRYWYMLNPPTGSSFNIVASAGGGGNEEMALLAAAFSDVDQTTPFGTQVATNGTNSTTSTGTVSLSGSDIALAAWSGYDANGGGYTITPNGTAIVEDENGNLNTTLGFQSRATGTLGWTHSLAVDSFQQSSIPLRAPSAGGSGNVLRNQQGAMSGGMQSLSGGMQGRARDRSRIIVPSNYMARGGRGAPHDLRV